MLSSSARKCIKWRPSGRTWWMGCVRARWSSSLQDVLKSYMLNKSSPLNTGETCVNNWSHFEYNLNICRPHQGLKWTSISWEFTRAAVQVKFARTVVSVFPVFGGSVRKYACQTWVKHHLRIIIGVCFNLLESTRCRFSCRIAQTVSGEF